MYNCSVIKDALPSQYYPGCVVADSGIAPVRCGL